MSIFGKYGVGGALPAKWAQGPDESTEDMPTANVGTCSHTPDTAPECTIDTSLLTMNGVGGGEKQ
jgi:hypothetical protein